MFRMEDLPDFGHEYNAYVLSYWARAQPGSSLHLALFAFSHALFGRANHVLKAIENADRAHARALVKMQDDMEDMNGVSDEMIDQLLVTTMLMSSYQVCSYSELECDYFFNQHAECHVRTSKASCFKRGYR